MEHLTEIIKSITDFLWAIIIGAGLFTFRAQLKRGDFTIKKGDAEFTYKSKDSQPGKEVDPTGKPSDSLEENNTARSINQTKHEEAEKTPGIDAPTAVKINESSAIFNKWSFYAFLLCIPISFVMVIITTWKITKLDSFWLIALWLPVTLLGSLAALWSIIRQEAEQWLSWMSFTFNATTFFVVSRFI